MITNTDEVTLPIYPILSACLKEDERIKNESSTELLKEVLKAKLGPLINDPELYYAIVRNIQLCNSKDDLAKAIEIVDAMRAMNSGNQCHEFLKGAHIVMNDGGALFNTLKQNQLLKDKMSSHHNNEKLSGISDASMQTGSIFNEVLFGVYKSADGQIHSWFQIESIQYKMTKSNIDPYGESVNTDLKPITLESMQKPVSEEELAPPEQHSAAEHEHAAEEHGHEAGEHEHALGGYEHAAGEHGHAAGEHEHALGRYEHAAGEHGPAAGEHEHALGGYEHVAGEHGHAAGEHEHALGGHEHAAGEHGHAAGEHEHALGGHEHAAGEHGHAAGEHGHALGEHEHTAGEHAHPRPKSFVAAVKSKNDENTVSSHL